LLRIVKRVLADLNNDWWVCIPEPVLTLDRLGHEGRQKSVAIRDVAHDEPERGRLSAVVRASAYRKSTFVLSRRDLVMAGLDLESMKLQVVR